MLDLSLNHYLTVSAVLFALGIFGIFLNRKNVITILMSIELMLLAVNINMVAFTGSAAAGKHIMASSANKLHRLVMELGGNDPMIVLADADINKAARFAVASSFENAGQMCTSTERIYVDERIHNTFVERVVEIAKQYSVGPWDQPRVNIGPIVNKKQHQQIIHHLKVFIYRIEKIRLKILSKTKSFVITQWLQFKTMPLFAIKKW